MSGDWLRLPALVIGTRWLAERWVSLGNKGFFGGHAWWAEERPVHGTLWIAYALSGSPKWLYTDACYGAVNWFKNLPL